MEVSNIPPTPEHIKNILLLQKEELNGYYTYLELSEAIKDNQNTRGYKNLAQKEPKYYQIWKRYNLEKLLKS